MIHELLAQSLNIDYHVIKMEIYFFCLEQIKGERGFNLGHLILVILHTLLILTVFI